jgi:hypothetical protein
MQFSFHSRTGIAIVAVLTAFACRFAIAQEAPKGELKGMPPRSSPSDYQAQAKAGKVTIAAEFTGHSIATPDSIFTTEDYVAVEVAVFGAPDSHLQLSPSDFSLRINGKKNAEPSQPYALIFKSLKDPSYEPPELAGVGKQSKGGLNAGGGGNQNDQGSLPPVVHIPIGIERAMEQKVQKAAFPEGDRPLPAAGLIFFDHRGKTTSAELIYVGPAGKATLTLAP